MTETRAKYQNVGFFLGPILAAIILFLPPAEGLSIEAWQVIAMALWMATWWATEAIPVPATSLIPLVFLPVMGVSSMIAAAAPYANPVIFLLLGGFIMAMALQRWNLHRRIALTILSKFGGHPSSLIGGFMVSAATLSMWVSNTATTIMMVPIALSLAGTVTEDKKDRALFTVVLLLGIAYSASIGGFGTLIGTPPNAMVRGYLEQHSGITISFTDWMLLGVPTVIVLLPFAWLILTKLVFPLKEFSHQKGKKFILDELKKMGPVTIPEKRTAIVFGLIALSWITRPLLKEFIDLSFVESLSNSWFSIFIPFLRFLVSFVQNLSDTNIAVFGALLMFMVPAGCSENPSARLLNWDWAVKLPWGVLLLFGGGLSLAAAIDSTSLSVWLGEALAVLTTFHLFILIGALVALIVFLTELTSNTATTAAFLPILGAIALTSGMDPILLAAPAALAASCAFMLPVATGPNAIIFASGQVPIPKMAKAGIWVNIAAIIVLTTMCYALVPVIFT